MKDSKQNAQPEADALTPEQIDIALELEIRRNHVKVLTACNHRERLWLKAVMENGGRKWLAAKTCKISKATVWRMLRQEHMLIAFRSVEMMMARDLDISLSMALREYMAIGRAKLRDAYYPKGHDKQGQLMEPHEWDEETAAAISEHSFDKDGRPTIKMHAKGPALDALIKLRSLGPPNRLELTGKDGEPLSNAIPLIQITRYSDEPEITPAPDDDDKPDTA